MNWGVVLARKPKWLVRKPNLPPDQVADLEASKGLGLETVTIAHRAYWLPDDPAVRLWANCLAEADKNQSFEPIIELLKSKHPLPPAAQEMLVDFLRRHEPKRRRGGQSVPAYDRSPAEAILGIAVEEVRTLVRQGRSVAEAITSVSKLYGVPEGVLENAYHGKRTSTKRMSKRRRP